MLLQLFLVTAPAPTPPLDFPLVATDVTLLTLQ